MKKKQHRDSKGQFAPNSTFERWAKEQFPYGLSTKERDIALWAFHAGMAHEKQEDDDRIAKLEERWKAERVMNSEMMMVKARELDRSNRVIYEIERIVLSGAIAIPGEARISRAGVIGSVGEMRAALGFYAFSTGADYQRDKGEIARAVLRNKMFSFPSPPHIFGLNCDTGDVTEGTGAAS